MSARKKKVSINDIFNELNDKNINYCSFKGNCSIENSFNGIDDFDLIVKRRDAQKLENILLNNGCKRRINTFDKCFYGVEDYLFYDEQQGVIHHFHIHFDIIFGNEKSKNYRISSDICFEEVLLHATYPIKIITLELELILICLRSISKYNSNFLFKNKILTAAKREKFILKRLYPKYLPVTEGIDNKKLDSIIEKFDINLKYLIYESIKLIKQEKISFLNIIRIKFKTRKVLRNYKRFPSKINNVFYKQRLKISKYSSSSTISNGKIISLLGPDGAGKTTFNKKITKWLNKKLTAESLFLGQVKNSRTNFLIKSISKIFKKTGFKKIAKNIYDLTHIVNAYHRKWALEKSFELSQRGHMVITDRFPLKEFWKMKLPMDGPKLGMGSKFYNFERSIYQSFMDYPHLIIILEIDINKSIERKPDEHNNSTIINNIKLKIKALDELEDSIIIHRIDANQPLKEVENKLKSIIWDSI